MAEKCGQHIFHVLVLLCLTLHTLRSQVLAGDFEDECNFGSNEYTNELCSDGEDNDCNGYVDCDDFTCLLDPSISVCDHLKKGDLGVVPEDAMLQLVLQWGPSNSELAQKFYQKVSESLNIHGLWTANDAYNCNETIAAIKAPFQAKDVAFIRSRLEEIMVPFSNGRVPSSRRYEAFWQYEVGFTLFPFLSTFQTNDFFPLILRFHSGLDMAHALRGADQRRMIQIIMTRRLLFTMQCHTLK